MRPERKLPRVDREETIEVHEDENAHLWAVSYADFLMALLSFFILFYSVDEHKRDEMILNISSQLAKDNVLGAGGGGSASLSSIAGSGAATQPAVVGTPEDKSRLIAALKGLDIKIEETNQYLVVNFPDDIFKSGDYGLNAGNRNQLARFLDIARPYDGKFNFYFEGHADSRPILHPRNRVVTDNYVLSSLRASNALKVARDAGFNEKFLFTQANSSNVRNSRSLSIRLELRKETI